jgi:uncharacterized membrane protein
MKNFKYRHITIIILAIGAILSVLLPSGGINDVVCTAFVVIAGFFGGKVEKGDELTERNTAKANKITLYLLIATLIVLTFLGDENERIKMNSYIPGVIAVCAIALRSGLFLWFDRSPKDDEVED